ncbi:MAG: hypothetical protein ACK2U6_06700 [Candidatus Promineifilaceae bacterium]
MPKSGKKERPYPLATSSLTWRRLTPTSAGKKAIANMGVEAEIITFLGPARIGERPVRGPVGQVIRPLWGE